MRCASAVSTTSAASPVTEALSFTLGARISHEEKAFSFEETRPLQNNESSFGLLKVSPSTTNLANAAIIGSGVYGVSNGRQVVSYRPPRMIFAGARFNFD
jgi:hypothetical protein